MQVKLLRAIQEKSVRPVGASEEIATDVRILCATHKNLEVEVAEGRFRQDLFYRLNVIQLAVAPLRERREDIHLLTQHLLHKLAADIGLPAPTLSKDAQQLLENYHFPGNVRELENILERAFTLCDSNTIDAQDLQLRQQDHTYSAAQEKTYSTGTKNSARNNTVDYPARCAEYSSLDEYLQDVEKEILCHALEQAKWNKTLSAKQLGISFRSLRYRLQKLGLDDE
jgi:two-component system response regulator PilR (NtrC family)